MNKYLVLILMIIIIFSVNFSLETAEINENKLAKNFKELETDFYKGTLSLDNLEENFKIFLDNLKNKKDNYLKFYYKAKTNFLLGEISKFQKKKEKAVGYYETAKKNAEKALELKKDSDTYNLAGKIYIRLLNKKGAFYAIRNGQKTFDLVNKAIELDKKNYSAYNSLALIYFQAPKVGGGDINKSEKYFKKALDSDSKIENFISAYYLAKVYEKKDNKNLRENYSKKAEKIFPDSYFFGK